MMEIEKKLANTDLNQFKTVPQEHLAKEIIRYQLWNAGKALDRINYAPLKRATALFYFHSGIRYLEGGKTYLSEPFKKLLDKYKNNESCKIIIPFEGCERLPKDKRKKSKLDEPIIPVEKQEKKPLVKSIVETFLYAVKIGNMFLTFNTQKEVDAFTQGFKMANPTANFEQLHINTNAIERIE